LRYVNAGHPAPMLVRRSQSHVERLAEGGPVLGLLPHARYSAGIVRVEDLDTLLVYSDGITEAMRENEEEFGELRVEQIIAENANAEPEQICRRIMSGVTGFANAADPQDDRTLMVVNFPSAGVTFRECKSEAVEIAAA
jgi:sigma-B regulation protein RsbU (phosphoserine phosphatase)